MTYPDKDTLPKGAETHLKNWARSKFFNRNRSISTKYTQKGNTVEDQAIELLSEYWNDGFLFKNEIQFENDWITGTPDIILRTKGVDTKCPWDWSTFPAFESKLPESDYFWQAQGYMDLTGLDLWQIAYVLCDTPEAQILKEARFKSYDLGMNGEIEDWLIDELTEKMTYSDIELSCRIKIFDVHRNNKAIQQIHGRVELCRDYLSELNF